MRGPVRRPIVVAIVAALAFLVVPVERSRAAAGDVDLEVTVSGVARGRIASLAPAVDWTVTVTNSTRDQAVTTSATSLTVRDVLAPGSPAPTVSRAAATVTTGTYNSTTGIWTIPILGPGATATLTFRSEFPVLSTSANPTLSAEVTAQGQPDLDSKPAEDTDIGNEDDEAVFNATTGANRKIGDQVWNDLNGDGRFASPEPGVRGVPVIVTAANGNRLYAGRTDDAGLWSYLLPDATTITVRFLAPAGSTFTLAKVGDDTADSDADATGRTTARTITAADELRIDAGLRVNADLSVTKTVSPSSGLVPVLATYSIKVTNGGPGPAAGVVLTDVLPTGAELVAGSPTESQGSLVTSASALTWTIGTLAAGATVTLGYQLNHPAPGTFTNRAQITAATTPDPDSVPNAAATACSAQAGQDDCASTVVTVTPRTGTVAGTVWRDTNGNGQRESGEPPQSEVTVRLRVSTSTGTVAATTVTAANGTWSMPTIAAGTYVVEVAAPAGASFTVSKQGAAATDSDVDSAGRVTVAVTAGVTTTVDAGLLRADTPSSDRAQVAQGAAVTFNVLDNDAVPGRVAGGALPAGWAWTRVEGPAWGGVTCQANGACTYRSTSNYAGSDRFRYTITNPLYGPATVDVTLDVSAVNDPPVARDDRAVTGPGQPVTVPVTANDEDPNDPAVVGDPNRPGDPPAVSGPGAVTPAGAGTVTCGPTSCTFSPAAGFTGVARFSYTVVDSGKLSAGATVEVFVDPDRPAASGFRDDESAGLTAGAGGWTATTTVAAVTACAAGRPQVSVQWPAVDRATGYRVERQSGDTGAWVEVANVDAATANWSDDLVGEGQTMRYRVTPVRYRWSGQPSAATAVTTPAATGPAGC